MNDIPQDRQAEEAVLGSVIINPETYYHVAAIISPADFYIHRNGWIFDAIGRLALSKTEIDLLTLSSAMDQRGEEYGGMAYLMSLVNQSPNSMNATSYAKIVAERSTDRKLIAAANEIAKEAYSNKSTQDKLAASQSHMMSATSMRASRRSSSKDAASMAIDLVTNHKRFFSFGVSNLDNQLSGIFPERLYIWAGYQGTGKTAFEIQNARMNADLGYTSTLISLEMSESQIWLRMACGDLGINIDDVLAGRVDSSTEGAIANRCAELGEQYYQKIHIYTAPMSLMDIVSAAKVDRPDIMWIDHSRLISGKPEKMSTYDWAMYIPTFLRQEVAKMKEKPISTHLLMQLNRSSAKEGSRRPTMHDLRMGGEDDPDMVTLMYRPEVDPELNTLPFGQVEVEFITDKNRFGWTGTEKVIFNLPEQRFLPTITKTTQLNHQVAYRAMTASVGSED